MNRLLIITPYHLHHPRLKRYATLWLQLAQAQTKIRVLCQYRGAEFSEPPLNHKNIEWLQPFMNYGLRDIASLTRLVYDFKPHSTQLTFDLNEKMKGWVYWSAPELVKNICASKLITSLHSELKSPLSLLLKYWMEKSQLVLVESHATEAILQAQSRPQSVDKIQIAPPPPRWPKSSESPATWLTENFAQWVFAPGEIRDPKVFEDVLNFHLPWLRSYPQAGLVIEVATLSARMAFMQRLKDEGVDAQVVVLTPRKESERWSIIVKCHALSVRHLSPTNLEVRDWVLGAIMQNKPVFANDTLFALSKILKKTEAFNLQDPFFKPRDLSQPSSIDAFFDQFERELCNTYLRIYQQALI